MTIAAFIQTPAYVIQGTGPYQISHPYSEGAIIAQVLVDSVPVDLDMDEVTVSPASSTTTGDLYLSAAQVEQYAGLTLWIDRDTAALQGWEARYGDREVGMESQLDRDTMILQELRSMIGASLRGRTTMEAYAPEAGHVPVVRDDGLGWTNGPTVSEIDSAEENAQIAAAAEEAAKNYAAAAGESAAGLNVSQRSIFVTWNSNGFFDFFADGTTLTVGGLRYMRKAGSTAIPDLLGWVPVAPAWPEHWNITDHGFGIVTYNGIPVTYNGATVTYDGAPNATALVTAMVQYCATAGVELHWGPGPYRFDSVACEADDLRALWSSRAVRTVMYSTKSVPLSDSYEADYFVKLRGSALATGTITTALTAGGTRLTLDAATVALLKVGESLIHVQSNRVIETDDRGQARVGWCSPVARIINDTTVELTRAFPMSVLASNSAVYTVTAVNASSRTITAAAAAGFNTHVMRYRLTFSTLGGAASTASKLPSNYNPDTGTYTFASGAYPTGVQVGDTFVVDRTLSYTASNSAKIDISGISFERDPHTGAAAGDVGFRGLYLARCLNPRIDNLTFRNFSETGLRIESSYGGEIENIDCHYCNRAYNVNDGTGYGVSVYQSSWGTYRNIFGFSCRRTLDVAGTQMIAWGNQIENVHGYGGGEAYDGNRFYPNGPTLCTVAGSHGAGYQTRYRDIRGASTYGVVNIRGEDEEIQGIWGCGQMQELLHIFYGDGVKASGFYYTDQRPDWLANPGLYSKSTRNGKLVDVISIDGTVNGYKPHHFSDFAIRGLSRSCVSLDTAPTIGGLVLGGMIDLEVDNEDGDNATFSYIRATGTGTPTILGVVDLGRPTIRNKISAPKTTINLMTMGNFTFASGAYVKWPDGSVRATIADDGVLKLPVHASGTGVLDLRLVAAGRTGSAARKATGVVLSSAGREDSTTIGQSTGVEYPTVPLSGTTGTDGVVSVAFTPAGAAGQYLYIENRRGAADLFAIAFTELAV